MRRYGRKEQCFLYVIVTSVGSDFYAKIGVSYHPKKRAVELQTGCPLKIQSIYAAEFCGRPLAFAAKVEAHSMLSRFRTCDEWFILRGEALERMFKDVETAVCKLNGKRLERVFW